MPLINFLREDRPESTSRLTLFITCVVVNLMVILTIVVYTLTEGKVDATTPCSILCTILLGAFVTNKIANKGKENSITNKE